jgi:hypothetical protein
VMVVAMKVVHLHPAAQRLHLGWLHPPRRVRLRLRALPAVLMTWMTTSLFRA